MDSKKRKYYNDPEKERDAAKKTYNNKKESIKQYKRGKYLEKRTPKNYVSERKLSRKS